MNKAYKLVECKLLFQVSQALEQDTFWQGV